MKTYKVYYQEVVKHMFYIAAESEHEAETELYKAADNGELDFSYGEVADSEITLIEEI